MVRNFSRSQQHVDCVASALLPAPYLSNQRRTRAFSQAQAPLSQITDPAQLCTPSRVVRHAAVMDTPPPQPSFRLRGSVTDPARLRRRPTYEQVCTTRIVLLSSLTDCNRFPRRSSLTSMRMISYLTRKPSIRSRINPCLCHWLSISTSHQTSLGCPMPRSSTSRLSTSPWGSRKRPSLSLAQFAVRRVVRLRLRSWSRARIHCARNA